MQSRNFATPLPLPTLVIRSFQIDLGDVNKGSFLSVGTFFLSGGATSCLRTKDRGEKYTHTHTHMRIFVSSLSSDSNL